MQYQHVGKTGVSVSRLCFGTVGLTSEQYARCRNAGINFFDTADVYDDGEAERVLGKCIAGHRSEVIISTKCGFPPSGEVNQGGLSRRYIFNAIEASLTRLGTDHVDFYFVHTFDPHTRMEETLRALDDIIQHGKARYLGVSNWAAWQIATALGISSESGLHAFRLVQPIYSLVKRQAEVEILPLARAMNLGVVPFSPLAGGLLSGKYSADPSPQEGRLSHDKLSQLRYGDPEYYKVAGRFTQHAQERGVHPAALALAWVMSHPAVTAPIFGASKLSHIDVALGALEIEMTPEWRAEISALSYEPPLATDRREEQHGFFYRDWVPEKR
jgi:aryl-alcohol dehydrogenase-like predicted oxidoreductase